MRMLPTVALAVLCALTLAAEQSNSAIRLVELRAPPPVAGSVTVSGGEQLRSTYYFDHNALKQAVRAKGVIVALTSSGNLLRFKGDTLELTGEHVVVGRGTAIAADDQGQLLLGTSEGLVEEIDSQTWAERPVGRSAGSILWIARDKASGGRTVAVSHARVEPSGWPGEIVDDYYRRRTRIWEPQAHDSIDVFRPGGKVSFGVPLREGDIEDGAFALGRAGELWIGINHGEFGGRLLRFDLSRGVSTTLKFDEDIRGFVKEPDGGVLAFGGLRHFWFATGFIARLGAGEPQILQAFENEDEPLAAPGTRNPPRPNAPVDVMVEDARRSGYWVVSSHTVFHVDRRLSSWSRRVDLDGRWSPGAKYAIAATPEANALLIDPMRPDDLVVAMGRDGLARLANGETQRRSFKGQLEIDTSDIWASSIGSFLLVSSGLQTTASKLGAEGWGIVPFFPDGKPLIDSQEWSYSDVVGDEGGAIIVHCDTGWLPGANALVRIDRDGHREVLDAWTGIGFFSSGWFLLPDHRAVMIADDELQVRGANGWRKIGTTLLPSDPNRLSKLSGRSFLPLGNLGAVSYYLNANMGELVKVFQEPSGSWRLEPLNTSGASSLANVFDAVPDGDDWVLAAAPAGLFRIRLADGAQRRIPSPNTAEGFTSIARDREGRLWTAGERIFTSNDDGIHWAIVDLPMAGRTGLKVLRANPTASRGVWLSLHDRGFVIIE